MSYTAPDYVDTKSQAILALASVIADDDKTALGDGSVNRALDVLADVLAETDVQVPQTNAGAILALAQYADGMIKPEGVIAITENGEGIDVAQYATADVSVSGGGVDFGPCVFIGSSDSVPQVNGYASGSPIVGDLTVGDTIIFTTIASDGTTALGNSFSALIAGGLSVATEFQSDFDTCTPYLVTIGECEEDDEGETYEYLGWKSVELWDGTITRESQTGDIVMYRWLFDVPVMDGNDYGIILVMSTSS